MHQQSTLSIGVFFLCVCNIGTDHVVRITNLSSVQIRHRFSRLRTDVKKSLPIGRLFLKDFCEWFFKTLNCFAIFPRIYPRIYSFVNFCTQFRLYLN